MEPQICARCRISFIPTRAAGHWSCRTHPGSLEHVYCSSDGAVVSRYTCCGVVPEHVETVLSRGNPALPRHIKAFASRDDLVGCLRLDHIPAGAAGAGAPNHMSLLARPPVFTPHHAIVVETRDWTLAAVTAAADWRVGALFINAQGVQTRVETDFLPAAQQLVDAAYDSVAFQHQYLATGAGTYAAVLATANHTLGGAATTGLSDSEVIAAYWRKMSAAAQPAVTLVVIRQSAPERDAAVVKRAESLAALLPM